MEVKGTTHLKIALHRIYNTGQHHHNSFTFGVSPNIYHHNLCTLKVSDRTIVPMAWEFSNFMSAVEVSGINGEPLEDKFIFPLVVTDIPNVIKRTADPIIGHLLSYGTTQRQTIKTASTPNGVKYHGGSGYIFDSEFTPLVIFGGEYIFTEKYRKRCNPVCVINPVVFQRDDLVSKYIVKKLIPYISDFKVSSFGSLSWESYDMKLIITPEIVKFMDSPSKPVNNLDKALWDCAKEYLNEIKDICQRNIY